MKNTNRIFLIACLIIGGLLILCARPHISLAGQKGPPTWKVKVVNKPIVNAQQSGDWDVNVSGEVSIINDELNPVPVTTDNVYRFVGVSTAATLPNIGVNGMHQLCQADFGDTARMCTTKEAFETPDLSSVPFGSAAWIQPVIAGVIYYPPNSPRDLLYVDVTGRSFFDEPYTFAGTAGSAGTCGTWQSNNAKDSGMRLFNNSGKIAFSPTNCTLTFPVACCDLQ